MIRAGTFDIAADGGKGHVGGKILIRVSPGGSATPPVVVDDNAVVNAPKFSGWEEVVDLPKEDSTHDIKIPKDADKLMQKKQVQDAA